MNGKKVENVFDNPNIRTVIESNKASYRWAIDPEYQDMMTAISPLTNNRVNRYVYVCRSREDLWPKPSLEPLLLKGWGRVSTDVQGWTPSMPLAAPPGRWIRIWEQNIIIDLSNT